VDAFPVEVMCFHYSYRGWIYPYLLRPSEVSPWGLVKMLEEIVAVASKAKKTYENSWNSPECH